MEHMDKREEGDPREEEYLKEGAKEEITPSLHLALWIDEGGARGWLRLQKK